MRNTVTLFHCFYRSSLKVLLNGEKSLKFNSWDFFMLSKHYILSTTINEDTTSSHLVKTDHESWGNHMIAVERTFFAKRLLLQSYSSKYCPLYLKGTDYYTWKMLPPFNNTYFKRLILLAGFPLMVGCILHNHPILSKLINVWLNTNKSIK